MFAFLRFSPACLCVPMCRSFWGSSNIASYAPVALKPVRRKHFRLERERANRGTVPPLLASRSGRPIARNAFHIGPNSKQIVPFACGSAPSIGVTKVSQTASFAGLRQAVSAISLFGGWNVGVRRLAPDRRIGGPECGHAKTDVVSAERDDEIRQCRRFIGVSSLLRGPRRPKTSQGSTNELFRFTRKERASSACCVRGGQNLDSGDVPTMARVQVIFRFYVIQIFGPMSPIYVT